MNDSYLYILDHIETGEKPLNMDMLGDRLTAALKYKNFSQSELAARIGVSPQSIQALCSNRAKKSRYLYEISEQLNVNPTWLISGEGPFLETHRADELLETNRVPLVTWRQVAMHELYNNPSGFIQTEFSGKNVYALQVEDESMSPKFESGYILIVDSQRVARNRDYVIIQLHDGSVMVRQYVENQTNKYYRAFANGFSITHEEQVKSILGVVVETKISFYSK